MAQGDILPAAYYSCCSCNLRFYYHPNNSGKKNLFSVITSYSIHYTKLYDYQQSSKVMGLENVIQRCYFFYPENDNVIEIKSSYNEGTEIIININTQEDPCIEF